MPNYLHTLNRWQPEINSGYYFRALDGQPSTDTMCALYIYYLREAWLSSCFNIYLIIYLLEEEINKNFLTIGLRI